jgi:para-nitrobenzyl esterase
MFFRTQTLCALAAGVVMALSANSNADSLKIKTEQGTVVGKTINGDKVRAFLGLPYAASPVGDLRWKAPQPVASWQGDRDSTKYGAHCAQGRVFDDMVFQDAGPSEDCLFLNVYTPANVKESSRLPVMFWIHGGGYSGGASSEPRHNGDFLPLKGVVLVTINYRLGVFGFLVTDELAKENGGSAGNYGLMDMVAALEWVKANITAFGGDPNNVTIFGESAGGASVCDQVASPTAAGLFQQGISISGFYNFNVNTIWWPADCKSKLLTERQAQQMGAQFAAKVGCGNASDVAACLRAVPESTLLAQAGQFESPFAGGAIGPIVNGTTLPMSAGEAFKLGRVNKVKLMIGVGRDEFNGGIYTNSPGHTVVANTPADYQQLVGQQFGPLAPKVMRLYPLPRFPSPAPFIAYRTIMADAFSVCPSLVSYAQLARSIPVYAYEDDDADSPGETQPLGANHSAINRLAHDDPASLDANQAALQDQVLAEWTGFARTGQPTVLNTPLWTRYTAPGKPVMSLMPAGDSTLIPTSAIMMEHNCGFWDAVNRTAPWAP